MIDIYVDRRAVLTQLGLAEVSSLENLSLADFPADAAVVAKELIFRSRYGRRNRLYQEQVRMTVEKEWNLDEVELKLNKEEIKRRL